MATSAEIKTKIEKLQIELETTIKEELKLSAAVAKVKELMEQTGVKLEHLSDGVKKERKVSVAKEKAIAKYINQNGDKTWNGVGRKPKWLDDLLAAGRALEEFLIKP